MEYHNWTGDQEYLWTVSREAAEPQPTEASFNIEVRDIYECITKIFTATI
jgi:hypothetical protein